MQSDFKPSDSVNFIAATAVAHAEGFVAGRCDAAKLYTEAVKLHFDIEAIEKQNDPASKSMIDLSKLLIIAMGNASAVKDASRLDRWREVMTALAKLVRLEVANLREASRRQDLETRLAELDAAIAAAPCWGAAVSVKEEERLGIKRALGAQCP